MAQEFNFIDSAVSASDRELFLGPFSEDDGPMITIVPGWTMAHLMCHAGLFPSVKQARNNGWNQPIPVGFEAFTVGKKKLKIFTLTRFD